MADGRAPAGAQAFAEAVEAVLLGGVRTLSANDLAQQAGVAAAAAEPCSQRFQW
ncbi:hypothetical protein [Nocardia sienata]|uniref:hypothetical protein n=1 Tax=Nocardia sienata TaxID=248552 RepID=UPI0012EE0435|nr:hypothetical protein [Nocardia sienata]